MTSLLSPAVMPTTLLLSLPLIYATAVYPFINVIPATNPNHPKHLPEPTALAKRARLLKTLMITYNTLMIIFSLFSLMHLNARSDNDLPSVHVIM
jgi:hypothetical protein